jgi:hypothetical protein
MTLPAHFTVSFVTAFTDQSEPEVFEVPADLSVLDKEALSTLHTQALEHFDALYGDGAGFSEEDVATLTLLTEQIEALAAEVSRRDAAEAERAEKVAALAAKIRPVAEVVEAVPAEIVDAEAEVVDAVVAAATATNRPENVRVSLANVRSRQTHTPAPKQMSARTMRDVVRVSGDVPGFTAGDGLDWTDVGRVVDRRLSAFNPTQYRNAAADKRRLREQNSVAAFRKPIPEDFRITSNDPEHVAQVMRRAMSESRLPGGSLVASGGWCAPSEVLYDLLELESRDGLISLPEVGVSRGGIQFTTGPEFAALYAAGFGPYTEANDIAGEYAGQQGGPHAVGSKPCFEVPCPTFEELRLELIGLCISAGLLQARGYPELIARTVRGALVAHDHRVSASVIGKMVAGSDAVSMTANQVGAAAPVLDAVELQAEHLRYTHRLSRSASIEVVFPYWVRGVIRSDLARRAGVAYLGVTDAQINEWFAVRGVAPQFVYDWQAPTGPATGFKAWPSSVQFLMYPAGAWVKGTSDVITLDTVHDSTMLGTNDYTALFTEEGYLVANMLGDSRVVTAPVCPSGAVSGGVEIGCDGVEVTAP